jgi:hypothetical protein
VTIVVGHRGNALSKTFERFILDEIYKQWGSRRFDISRWAPELCVGHTPTWRVEAGGEKRLLCGHDKNAVARLDKLLSILNALMR